MNTIIYHNQPRQRVQFIPSGKSRTKQSFKDECDINKIMARYQKTGAMAHVNQHGAEYGFASSIDFSEAMRLITTAQDMFDGLPSSIRTRFANDPGQFLDFVQDANNTEEMIKLGLMAKTKAPEKPSETKKDKTPDPATKKETQPLAAPKKTE